MRALFPRSLFPALMGLLAALAGAASEMRFPPPEFETDYTMPGITTPPPRSLAMEYVDTALLVTALGLAAWLVHRRRSRRGLVALSVFSLVYFGFIRTGCICPIGAPQNVALGMFDPGYTIPLTALAFFLVPLVFSLFWGRTFCAAVCPHGALQDLVLIKPVKVPLWIEQGLGIVPFIFLGLGIWLAATGTAFIICRYDAFIPLFRMNGSVFGLALGGIFLAAALFIGRPFCRFLCPYGALLRLGSIVSRKAVRITPDYCTQCRLCEHSCPFGAIREPVKLPVTPNALAPERRRLTWLILALPVLIAGGAWLGSKLSVAAAKMHPTVALAEQFLAGDKAPAPATALPTPETRALGRAAETAPELIAAASEVRRRLGIGGWWFGGWVGLVIGARLISLSLRPNRTDFEPDRGACYACGRCYLACPNERVRVGLITPAEAAALQAHAPVPRPDVKTS